MKRVFKSTLKMSGLLLLIMVFGSIGGIVRDTIFGTAVNDIRAHEFRLVDQNGKTRGIFIIPFGTGDNPALILTDERGRCQALYSSNGLTLFDQGKPRAGFILNQDGNAVIRLLAENGNLKKEIDFSN